MTTLDTDPARTDIDLAPQAVPAHSTAESRRSSYSYRVPLQTVYAITLIWSVASGLSVGVAVALVVEINGGSWLSYARIQWVTGLVVALLLFAVIARRYLRHHTLRVAFDDAERVVHVRPPFLRGRRQQVAYRDVRAFELIAWPMGWRTGGALVIQTAQSGTIILVALSRNREIESSGLPSLVDRLNTHLRSVRRDMDQPDTATGELRRGYYQPRAHRRRSKRRASKSRRPTIEVQRPAALSKASPADAAGDPSGETQTGRAHQAAEENQTASAPPGDRHGDQVVNYPGDEPDRAGAPQDGEYESDHDDDADIGFGMRPSRKKQRSDQHVRSLKNQLPSPKMEYWDDEFDD